MVQAQFPGLHMTLVIMGSPTLGFFGGKIAEDLTAVSSRLTRLEGKAAAAFVTPGSLEPPKSLKAVMALLEKQGAMVQDFAALQGQADVEQFGRRLLKLLGR